MDLKNLRQTRVFLSNDTEDTAIAMPAYVGFVR